MRTGCLTLALVILAACWVGPLPGLAEHSFAAHMMMHTTVVAVAAPLFAFAVAGTRTDPVRSIPHFLPAIPASMIELIIVWTWHAPAFHRAARSEPGMFVLEQASFLAGGVLLWIAAVGGTPEQRRSRAGGGVVALLFTSMHMTLLGALFTLASRPLFVHAPMSPALAAAWDQQVGGVIMLLVGGASYLIGGLWLTGAALVPASAAVHRRKETKS